MSTIDEIHDVIERERERVEGFRHRLLVCTASGCPNGRVVREALAAAVDEAGRGDEIEVAGVGCMGLCAKGTLVSVHPAGLLYGPVSAADAAEVVASVGGDPIERLVVDTEVPFFTRQLKVVLEGSGRVEPDRIESALAAGGYGSLIRALSEMTPFAVIDEVTRSGLRGRGGGGYPTGLKWSTVAKAEGDLKFVICNADEGDPGAFMDRSVLESDPHRVLEGMAIAAYAVGASRGFIYVRAEYPLAIERLQTAIKRARRLGLLGRDILTTPFDFDIEVRLGAGAFVCGEETALIASIEGRQGHPVPRPPYPAERGLWGRPTLINNVETLANVPAIVRDGGDRFAALGTEGSKGTKVFALAGRVANTGLVEVPMGTTLHEIIHEIGGGVPEGRTCKAVQTGGPSGGCIPADLFDTPVDYESLLELGSMMGSGGMIVMDETSDMVDVARFFMEFCMTESCGKCVPCRVGTAHLHDLLRRITDRQASPDELVALEELCEMVRDTSLCGLGQSAPNPVLSTLRHFHDEYVEHLAAGPASGEV
jgi:bidirectional [NiFe] hydrogenase diaphorase subunit